jgi:hypothetical protein
MPDKEDILSGLQTIVDNYSTFAIIWHGIFYFLLAAIVFIWQPSNRLFALIICLPVVSVATFAWLSGNVFNGFLFSLLACLIIIFGLKASNNTITASQISFVVIGIIMITFGLIYPHFVGADSFLKYLYASPVSLIPCPTLSIIIGLLLVYNGFDSQSLTLTLIFYGLFYGIFGTMKLGVTIDLFLIFGTLSLLIKYILSSRA